MNLQPFSSAKFSFDASLNECETIPTATSKQFFCSGTAATIFFVFCLVMSACKSQQKMPQEKTQRIAFARKYAGANHIYLMDINESGIGKNVQLLTSDMEAENYPSVSTDGKKIIYQRDYNGAAIYIVDTDGTNQQRLSATPGFDVNPSWSPDGKQIIYTKVLGLIVAGQVPKTELHVMNIDGSADKVILAQTDFSVEPRWSANNQIVFMSKMNGGLHIFTMDADGANVKQLTTQGNNGDPVWSPDGLQISFGSDREGNGKLNIFLMNADGSNVRQITHFLPPIEAGDTHWSMDGKKIAFEYDVNGNLQSDPNAYAEVWIMNADGSGQVSTSQPCSAVGCSPNWLPVGN